MSCSSKGSKGLKRNVTLSGSVTASGLADPESRQPLPADQSVKSKKKSRKGPKNPIDPSTSALDDVGKSSLALKSSDSPQSGLARNGGTSDPQPMTMGSV